MLDLKTRRFDRASQHTLLIKEFIAFAVEQLPLTMWLRFVITTAAIRNTGFLVSRKPR